MISTLLLIIRGFWKSSIKYDFVPQRETQIQKHTSVNAHKHRLQQLVLSSANFLLISILSEQEVHIFCRDNHSFPLRLRTWYQRDVFKKIHKVSYLLNWRWRPNTWTVRGRSPHARPSRHKAGKGACVVVGQGHRCRWSETSGHVFHHVSLLIQLSVCCASVCVSAAVRPSGNFPFIQLLFLVTASDSLQTSLLFFNQS